MLNGELKYQFIRTPLERPLMRLRDVAAWPRRRRAPELHEIHVEAARIDAVFRKFVMPDMNCIDVGCHYGSALSRFCALAPRGQHIAFEAIPSKARFLRRKFPDVQIMEMAAADREDVVEFFVRKQHSGFSGMARVNGGGEEERISVQAARLDTVVPSDRRFGLVKIDVEGAERLVLDGASDLLARDKPVIVFECGPDGPAAFGYTAGDLHDSIAKLDYAVHFLKDAVAGGPSVTREVFEQASRYPFQAFNWLALPRP